MRRPDELMALYPGQDTWGRKFILNELLGFSHVFDRDDVLEFLRSQTKQPDAELRDHARFVQVSFLPGFVFHRHGIVGGRGAAITRTGALYDLHIKKGELGANTLSRRRRACQKGSRPLVQALVDLKDDADAQANDLWSLALGQFPDRPAREALERSIERSPQKFMPSVAYAMLSSALADEGFLLDVIQKHAWGEPALWLLLSFLQSKEATTLFRDSIKGAGMKGRFHLATALSLNPIAERMDSIEPLLKHREVWTTVLVLRAIERTRLVQYVPFLSRLYASCENDFLKMQILRCAGRLPDKGSIGVCFDALKNDNDLVQAQALESLSRLRCPPDSFGSLSMQLLQSASVRTRVNALLTVGEIDDPMSLVTIDGLLLSDDALDRLEGAYCLGYMQSQRALSQLTALCSADPSVHVRIQAVKSLSKYPFPSVEGLLVRLIESGDAPLARVSCQIIMHAPAEDATNLLVRLRESMIACKDATRRAWICRCLGYLSRASGSDLAIPLFLEYLEDKSPSVAMAAVDALLHSGRAPADEADAALAKFATHSDPRLAARAGMTRFFLGRLASVSELSKLLGLKDKQARATALDMALEMGLMMRVLPLEGRFPQLEKKLDSLLGSPNYQDSMIIRDLPQPTGFEASAEDKAVEDFPVRTSFDRLEPIKPDVALAPGGPAPGVSVAKLEEHLRRTGELSRNLKSEKFAAKLEKASHLLQKTPTKESEK